MQGHKFDEMKQAREITLEELPSQIHWDGDHIYLANKKFYQIMDKESGKILQRVALKA